MLQKQHKIIFRKQEYIVTDYTKYRAMDNLILSQDFIVDKYESISCDNKEYLIMMVDNMSFICPIEGEIEIG